MLEQNMFLFSPGASSDDKIMSSEDFDLFLNNEIVITEKLDGSNICLTRNNVFARSHSGPPDHASFDPLVRFHKVICSDIDENISIFGEWTYAVHSIEYKMLSHPLNIFGIRDDKTGEWWDWDMVSVMASDLNIPTVPVILRGIFTDKEILKSVINEFSQYNSIYGPIREGLVIRLTEGVKQEKESFYGLGKWVRKNHVNTNTHWKSQKIKKQSYLSFI